MGLLLDSIRPSTDFLQDKSPLAVWSSALVGVVVLSIVLNVLRQVLFKNPAEPPMVFHLLPFLGSTITYGIDPYKFFFACREKVCDAPCVERVNSSAQSMEMYSRSYCLARRRPSVLA